MSILRARDRTRDQSYFLCSLRQRTLRRVRFPLGELTTKSRARRHNAFELLDHCLSPSRDACFLGIGGLPELLRERLGPLSEGSIVDSTGTLLGSHRGAALYTVGQRKGLGIGGGPWYVLGTDVRRNVVTVGTASEAHRRCLGVGRLNWVSASPQRSDVRAQVQIRSSHRAASAVICPTSATRAVVEFDTPQFGIAPGQFAVLYDGDLLLAGGRILPVR
jgi:tRNA-specific 2-thiouridylase